MMPLLMAQCVAVVASVLVGESATAGTRNILAAPVAREQERKPVLAIVTYNLGVAPAGASMNRAPADLREYRLVSARSNEQAATGARPTTARSPPFRSAAGGGLSAVYSLARSRPSMKILGQRIVLSGFMLTRNRSVIVVSTTF